MKPKRGNDCSAEMSERDNYRVDFEFPGLIEQIEDRGDYVAFRTPSLPGFFWGNYLLFPNPPGPEDYSRWRAAYRAEFGSVEELHHEQACPSVTTTWSGCGGPTASSVRAADTRMAGTWEGRPSSVLPHVHP